MQKALDEEFTLSSLLIAGVLRCKICRVRPVREVIRICFPLCSHFKQLAVPLILE